MLIVRAVRVDDVDPLLALVRKATVGLTSLQLDRPRLLERVERSQFAFTRQSESIGGEPYVLVMQESEGGPLLGTATVYAKTGGYEPFYAYRLVTTTHHCPQLRIRHRRRTTLHLQRVHDGPTEIGSLFLLPEMRGQGRGRFLSLSRFALLAQRPQRFADRVIAEMRGPSDARGVSPFWEAVMRPFFGIDFPVADALSTVSKTFIEDLMPQHPIYLDLIPAEARSAIGRVHQETEPALQLLAGEGFRRTDMVDIFDAGPVLECTTHQIGSVARCRRVAVDAVAEHAQLSEAGPADSILSSMKDGFRSVLATTRWVDEQQQALRVDSATADALAVAPGDPVWVMPLRPVK